MKLLAKTRHPASRMKAGDREVPPMPNKAEERAIQTILLFGVMGGLLASISLSINR